MRAHAKWLDNIGACGEAVEFADTHKSLKAAWEACTRPDWMLWLLRIVKHDNPKSHRLFACWCVRNTPLADGRTVWDLLTDDHSKNAVIVAGKHANGEATDEELVASGAAAWAAVRADASDAARAAAEAASGADASDAARDASGAAALAASRADAGADARADALAAARADARAAQAAKIREMFPWSVVELSIKNFKKGVK